MTIINKFKSFAKVKILNGIKQYWERKKRKLKSTNVCVYPYPFSHYSGMEFIFTAQKILILIMPQLNKHTYVAHVTTESDTHGEEGRVKINRLVTIVYNTQHLYSVSQKQGYPNFRGV